MAVNDWAYWISHWRKLENGYYALGGTTVKCGAADIGYKGSLSLWESDSCQSVLNDAHVGPVPTNLFKYSIALGC
jgi:hypothetical protein